MIYTDNLYARLRYLSSRADLDYSEEQELKELIELRDDIGKEQFEYGVMMIPESEFEDHARNLAEEISAIPEGNRWPVNHIDWKAAAEELRLDYQSVSFNYNDYLWRPS